MSVQCYIIRAVCSQKKARRLHRAIARGHLAEVKENVDSRVMRVRDFAGLRALHIAVLFERRLVIYELLRNYPDAVNLTDHVRICISWALSKDTNRPV